jgi:hypothetical protein
VQTGEQTGKQAGRQASRQAGEQTNKGKSDSYISFGINALCSVLSISWNAFGILECNQNIQMLERNWNV